MTTNEKVHKLSDKNESALRSVNEALTEALEVSKDAEAAIVILDRPSKNDMIFVFGKNGAPMTGRDVLWLAEQLKQYTFFRQNHAEYEED